MDKKTLIEFITLNIFPGEDQRLNKNRVRQRIDRALRKKELRQINDNFDEKEFFSWAFKKWPGLEDFIKLPKAVSIGMAVTTSSAIPLKNPYKPAVPESIEELKTDYIAKCIELYEVRKEFSSLNNDYEDLFIEFEQIEEENKNWREKAEKRRQTAVKNGGIRHN